MKQSFKFKHNVTRNKKNYDIKGQLAIYDNGLESSSV